MGKMIRLFSIVIMTVAAIFTAACASKQQPSMEASAQAGANDGAYVSAKDRVDCKAKRRHHMKKRHKATQAQEDQTTTQTTTTTTTTDQQSQKPDVNN